MVARSLAGTTDISAGVAGRLGADADAGLLGTRVPAVRSVKIKTAAVAFLAQRASASRTRCTIISSSTQAVSGCSRAKGRKTHAVNRRQRNSVSAVIVAER